MGLLGKLIGAAADDAAEKIADAERSAPPDPWRWAKRALALGILLLGWVFILWANRFHVTASTIIVCLGFLAIELAVYNLFRTGARAVADDEENDDSTWGRPLGARAELEREKKALLKAIKEAEFDREMGKLSAKDAEEMIGLYRARAIEVIKEIDKLGGGAGTIREQIEREVKARLELEAKAKHASAGAAGKASNAKAAKNAKKNKKAPAAAAKDAADAAEKAADAAEKAAAAATAAASPSKEPGADAIADAAADEAANAAAEAKEAAAEAKEAAEAASSEVSADEPPPAATKATAKEATT